MLRDTVRDAAAAWTARRRDGAGGVGVSPRPPPARLVIFYLHLYLFTSSYVQAVFTDTIYRYTLCK